MNSSSARKSREDLRYSPSENYRAKGWLRAEHVAPKDSPVPEVSDHIRRYVASGGADGHEWLGTKTLLLTTIGRRSGAPRRTALTYARADGHYVVLASKGGADSHPLWYLNLTVNPEVRIQVKDTEFRATARTAQGEERARLWDVMIGVWPGYNEFQARTGRQIPVVVLEPAEPAGLTLVYRCLRSAHLLSRISSGSDATYLTHRTNEEVS
jgi:deazaflavin-dependent oxidoreductase (nitroreductase family)